MSQLEAESKILARAIYEIRVLLSSYLGSEADGSIEVRTAAHLAYALHNDCLAVIEGSKFETNNALARIKSIDTILNNTEGSRIAALMSKENV